MSRDEENIDEPEQNGGANDAPGARLPNQDAQHPDGAEGDELVPDAFATDGEPADGEPAEPGDGEAGDGEPTASGEVDESDLLFEPTTEPEQATEKFAGRQQFAEGSPAKWGGHDMSADEIGIPVDQEPGYMSSEDDFGLDSEQELELVDDERQLGQKGRAAAAAAAPSEDEDLVLEDEVPADGEVFAEAADAVLETAADANNDGEFFVLDEGEVTAESGAADGDGEGQLLRDEPLPADSYPVEEGWEPVAAEGENTDGELVESGVGDGAAPEPVAAGFAPRATSAAAEFSGDDANSFASQYHEEQGPAVIAAAPPRRGRVVRMLASACAASLVIAAGAVVVLRPEWLGMHFEPQLVERVQVARPNVDARIAPPPMPVVVQTTPITTPVPVPIDTRPAQPTDPVATAPTDPVGSTPVATDPVAGSDPLTPTPVPDAAPTTSLPSVAAGEQLPSYLPVGDSMWIGNFDGRQRGTAEWAQVRLGAKAFAQLVNGNYFIGSVKAVNSDALILTVPAGEVTLLRDEVEKVATLDSQEYSDLQQATTGFLRLSNRNRLAGTILKSVVDDNYVLQMRSDRIVVPRAFVEQVVAQPGVDGLRFGGARDEEEWLRGIAAQQLQAMSTGMPAGPGGEGRGSGKAVPKQNKPLPIKEAGRKVPVDRPGK